MQRPTSRFRRLFPAAAALAAALTLGACDCDCPEEEGVALRSGDSVVIEPSSSTARAGVADSVVIEPGAARRTVRVFMR